MRFILLMAIFAGLIIAGCTQTVPPSINTTNQSNMTYNTTNSTTINSTMTNSTIPSGYEVASFCNTDTDCVRLNSCCDCGAGVYVNKYNQQNPQCKYRCECATGLSHGACQNNKCVAVSDLPTSPPPNSQSFNFTSGSGYCGDQTLPQITNTPNGLMLNGSVGGGSVCRYADAQITLVNGIYVLNISTRAIPGVDTCINCAGAIPWNANVSGYSGEVDVYYDGVLVSPVQNQTSLNYTFNGENGRCGTQIAPSQLSFGGNTQLVGSIGAPNSCVRVSSSVTRTPDGTPILRLTTMAIPGVAACVTCSGTVPWSANISGYTGNVDVYYNGNLVQPTMNMNLVSSTGVCGNASTPTAVTTNGGLNISGMIGAPSVCHTMDATLGETDSGTPVLNMTTMAIPGIDTCINCNGSIAWNGFAPGYSGPIQISYDGNVVYPPQTAGFCGESTYAPCLTISDCSIGGCSGEVCQGVNEQPVITSCIYKSCNNAQNYSLKCGCFNKQCQWA